MRFTSPIRFVDELVKLGKLSNDEAMVLKRLREIRNISVHAPQSASLTIGEVVEFNELAKLLITKFNKIKEEPGYIDIKK